MKKLTVTRKELEAFAINVLGIRRAALRRMSTLFLSQLLQMNLMGEQGLNEMMDEISWLEKGALGIPVIQTQGPGTRRRGDAWIVFKRQNGNNYYLTLAKVNEGDQHINRRLHDAYRFDFPFLEEKHRLN